VGCATGYAAALASQLAGKVTATENDPDLAATGREILARRGIKNATFQLGEPGAGAPASGPYDVIMLNGATEIVPEQLYGQLKDGGRLVGVFALIRPSRAMIVTHSHNDFGSRTLFDAAAPVLPGLEQRPAFVF
jgi:protein-L-isoaspartate(D-aspartate) O-methyltransferase